MDRGLGARRSQLRWPALRSVYWSEVVRPDELVEHVVGHYAVASRLHAVERVVA